MEDSITVHIADDHQVLIDGVKAVLKFEKDIDVIGFSLNGNEVLDWFTDNYADILLLDINMPEMDGIEVLRKIKQLENIPNVIIMSSYDDIKLVKEVLNLGAKGFIPKKAAGNHVVKAIRKVVHGEQYFTEDIKEKMMNALIGKPLKGKVGIEGMLLSSLTNREFQILQFIAQQYSTKEISDSLNISESTVETHRKNLMRKLKVKNSIGLAIFAMKNKIV